MPCHTGTEDDIDEAALDMANGGLSLRKAAQKWGIPPQTLSDRLNQKSLPKDEAEHPNQPLSNAQEDALVQWILK